MFQDISLFWPAPKRQGEAEPADVSSGVHADAIMDRIVHNTIWVETGGHNMREHTAGDFISACRPFVATVERGR